jgi:hypothetical protein
LAVETTKVLQLPNAMDRSGRDTAGLLPLPYHDLRRLAGSRLATEPQLTFIAFKSREKCSLVNHVLKECLR